MGGGGRHRAVHPFPARMSYGLARGLIEECERERGGDGSGPAGPMTIVDPMVGSGTVMAAALERGHRAIGFDIDPLAVLAAEVGHCATFDAGAVRDAAARIMASAKEMTLRDGGNGRIGDDETRAFIQYWFDGTATAQLEALADAIDAVNDANVRNVLRCALSRLVIAKQAGASRAADLTHSRPHRAFAAAPQMPFDGFARAVQAVIQAASRADDSDQAASVAVGDSRRVAMPGGSADMVLTSPPYVNAIDYMRCSKFSLVWMGHGIGKLRDIRSASIGTEVGLHDVDAEGDVAAMLSVAIDRVAIRTIGDRRFTILARYASDMLKVMAEARRVLRTGGTAVFVVGENVMRGVTVRTPDLVRSAAGLAGLKTRHTRYREIPAFGRCMPPPHGGHAPLDRRMRREAIVVAAKA